MPFIQKIVSLITKYHKKWVLFMVFSIFLLIRYKNVPFLYLIISFISNNVKKLVFFYIILLCPFLSINKPNTEGGIGGILPPIKHFFSFLSTLKKSAKKMKKLTISRFWVFWKNWKKIAKNGGFVPFLI